MVLTTTMMAGHQQMTAREKDIYDTYSEDLEGLTFNSKPVINSMTELANEYSSDFAHVIVRCIEDKIKLVSSSQKLPLLYLLDSILKNHTRPYHDLLQQNIVSIFAHVFHNVPRDQAEKIRTALYKLRLTWTDTYFSLTKLNQLDKKIQALDPQWPIIPSKKAIPVEKNLKPPGQSIHINPAVFGRQQSLNPENDLEAQLKQKELELMELKMKKEELALENIRKQISSGRDAQDRAKSPGQNATGISTTSVINKATNNRIIIDEKKLKDPRMRNKILEAINKAEGINKTGRSDSSYFNSRDNISKSMTPERTSRTPERLSRSKSKSPSSQRNSTGQATSTTGFSSISSSKHCKTSRTPSPIRARQSPTSTSSPRYADTTYLSNESKGTTPPPPPRISDVIKGDKNQDKKTSDKTIKREKTEFDSKDKTNQPPGLGKTRKRKNEENVRDRDGKKTLASKPSKSSTNSRMQKEGVHNTLRRSRDEIDNESNSSPSPPPEREKKSGSTSKEKDTTSSGINFRLKARQKVKKEKNPFRIPKKEKADTGKQDDKRTPSPQSFTSEGPLVEFNEGRSPLKERKRHGSKSGNSSQSRVKKSKLSNELFGDGKNNGKKTTPVEGWATVKKEKPDLFRTPVMEGRAGHGAAWRGGFRNVKANQSSGIPSFTGPFQANIGIGINQQGKNAPQFEKVLEDMKNFDPNFVLTQVIPNIVQQGQSLMATGKINVEQFSQMMKGVFELKEHALMQQAENRHIMQLMDNFMKEDSLPLKNPLITQLSCKSQNINETSVNFGKNTGRMRASFQHHLNDRPRPLLGMPPPLAVPLSAKTDVHSSKNPVRLSPIDPRFRCANLDLPLANDNEVSEILNDPVKRIEIDNYPRDIRFYGKTALIIMGPEAKDMREITFKTIIGISSHRRLIIDQKHIISVNIDPSVQTMFKLGNESHTVRIGAPTRELWVDGQWNELLFNKKRRMRIGPATHEVLLEGPPPNVDIGSVPRNDLCVGTVQLIIDGDINTIVTIYLDSKPQVVNIAGKQHILKFVQGLKMLLINGHPFRTEFGGMPMVVYVNQVKHYLRLTALPGGVKLNSIKLWNMDENQSIQQNASSASTLGNKIVNPQNSGQTDTSSNIESSLPTSSQNPPSPGLFNENSQEAYSVAAQNNAAFDRLINMIPTTPTNLGGGLKMPNESSCETNIQEGEIQSCSYTSTPVQDKTRPVWKGKNKEQSPTTDVKPESITNDKSVDVHNLWAQLLGAGLVSNPSTKANAIPGLDAPVAELQKTEKQGLLEEKENQDTEKSKQQKKKAKTENSSVQELTNRKENKSQCYKEIILKSHHSSIKTRQTAIIDMVYDPTALQCKNCGLRFSSSQSDTEAYSQHLDWHFRVKRREKDNAKKAESRRWYFEKVDWIVSDEIEEDKEGKEDPKSRSGTPDEIPMVPAGSTAEDNICPICHEEFDQFYKQDFADSSSSTVVGGKGRTFSDDDGGGRWHLKNAIRPEVTESDSIDLSTEKYAGRAFHPQCYQDRNNTTLNDTSTSIDQIKSETVSTNNLLEDVHENIVAKGETDASELPCPLPQQSDDCKDEVKTSDNLEIPFKKDADEAVEKVEASTNIQTEEKCSDSFNTEETTQQHNVDTMEVSEKTDSPNPLVPESNVESNVEEAIELTSTKIENELTSESNPVKMEVQDPSEAVDDTPSEIVEDIKKEEKDDSINLINKSLDGNTLMTAPLTSGLGSGLSGGIRINIRPSDASKQEMDKKEISRSVSESDDGESERGAEFDQDAIVQAAKPEHADLKPKLKGRKLDEMPMQKKGSELSSLCSIM